MGWEVILSGILKHAYSNVGYKYYLPDIDRSI